MEQSTDLNNQEGIAKMKKLAKSITICMFCTSLDKQPFQTRPMAVQEVDDEGNLWFLSSRSSDKNIEIKDDEDVQLLFANPAANQYLNVFGTATIYTDHTVIEALWTPIAKAWFSQGVDDPDLSVIKIAARSGYYWDTKSGKIVSLVKIALAAATGMQVEEGVQGKIAVRATAKKTTIPRKNSNNNTEETGSGKVATRARTKKTTAPTKKAVKKSPAKKAIAATNGQEKQVAERK